MDEIQELLCTYPPEVEVKEEPVKKEAKKKTK